MLEASPDWPSTTRLALSLVPTPLFAWFLWNFVRGIRGADELERRIQLEALAVAFLLACLLITTLGLVQRAVTLNFEERTAGGSGSSAIRGESVQSPKANTEGSSASTRWSRCLRAGSFTSRRHHPSHHMDDERRIVPLNVVAAQRVAHLPAAARQLREIKTKRVGTQLRLGETRRRDPRLRSRDHDERNVAERMTLPPRSRSRSRDTVCTKRPAPISRISVDVRGSGVKPQAAGGEPQPAAATVQRVPPHVQHAATARGPGR